MRRLLLKFGILVAAGVMALSLSPSEVKAQQIILPCVPSGTSCIPVSAANPLPTTGGGGTFPPAGCVTANGVIFNNATPCDGGLTYAGSGGATTFAAGTITSTVNSVNITQTWNSGGTTFGAPLFVSVTSTASATPSLLMDLRLGGGTVASINKGGTIAGTGFQSTNGIINIGQVIWSFVSTSASLGFGNPVDTFLTRPGAANWQFGAANAAAPVAQTLSFQGSRGGTDSNVAGVNATIVGSLGTGTGGSGKIIMQVGLTGTTGTTQNSPFPLLSLNPAGATTSTVQFGDGTNITTYDSCTALTTGVTGIIACTASAIRFKELYAAVPLNIAGLAELRTDVPWRYREDAGYGLDPTRVHIGLLADDVAALDKRCVVYRRDDPMPTDYEDRCVLAYLVAARNADRAEFEAYRKVHP